MFHLGWFLGTGFGIYGWNQQWSPANPYEFLTPRFYTDMARALERACFDLLIIEDSSYVPLIYQDSRDMYVRHAITVPKHDPVPLATAISRGTEKIGVVPTLSTTEYPPYLLARLINTLDHISHGRTGWNMVTSSSHHSAQNYGHDQLIEHDKRYDMADEYVDLVTALWGSWEADAMVNDPDAGILADPTKVHQIDFEGTYFRSRGPLSCPPSPQGRPLLVQAGGSPRGKAFGARTADAIVANPRGIPAMKRYAEEIRDNMVAFGRKPTDCKVLFMINPVLGETMEEAQDRDRRMRAQVSETGMQVRLARTSSKIGYDLSQFDLDEPLPELTTNSHQATLADLRGDGTRTLREVLTLPGNSSLHLVGTPDAVAAQMGEAIEEAGGDGYLLSDNGLTRRYIAEITDGLIPALQRRGLTRSAYDHDQVRDNLLDF